jgi:hypothetical protein
MKARSVNVPPTSAAMRNAAASVTAKVRMKPCRRSMLRWFL